MNECFTNVWSLIVSTTNLMVWAIAFLAIFGAVGDGLVKKFKKGSKK